MKKTIVTSILLATIVLVPTVALGQFLNWGGGGWGGSSPNKVPEPYIDKVLNNITNWLFAILLIVAAIFIIIAGYFFVTAAGDPEKTKRARDFIMYALIGVLVGFVAKGLVALVGIIVMN